MTYLELYKEAERKLEKNEITIGEYEEMIAPLSVEILEKEKGTLEKIRAEIRQGVSHFANENGDIAYGFMLSENIVKKYIGGKE